MKQLLDTRSLIIGLLLGVIATMTIAATTRPNQLLEGSKGRYKIVAAETYGYLVDTVTGQVWNNGHNNFFEPKLKSMKE